MGDHTDTSGDEARLLRTRLVGSLRSNGVIRTEAVEAAMLAVPRHRFVPEAPLHIAYADDVYVTKRDSDGEALSSASQPSIVAEMLEQLDVRPGHRVLEIGAGTGYNAALLDSMVGPRGSVTTVDIDADTVRRARKALDEVGGERVRVVQGDGQLGCADGAPYDRLIATVGTWDLPPAWWDQLVDGGRLVAPLSIRGCEHSVAFDHVDGVMRSRSIVSCGFMPMRGLGSQEGRTVELSEGRIMTFHVEHEVGADGARGALDGRGMTAWTGVQLNQNEDATQLSLWLACAFVGYGRMSAPFGDHGLQRLLMRWANPAVVEGEDFAYLVCRRTRSGTEIGVRGHGPSGAALAARVAAEVREWDTECRDGVNLQLTAYRRGHAFDEAARFTVPKRHTALAIQVVPVNAELH
ncbi:methyltransferase, FxLD system [Glycomyces sp. TRM65418]|uniref:methyltransferase, FxLD system n=1 Tax=Glycomyces sp. TRM65418 TaxID=2867006 RepID=UPI001CE511FA|nr:methyltransferase, FxLD system [Glycomyces sp. TRM65418]MCC3765772.1 methyltransferase, FxLD system [Glycomyces sp. TRM65418]QZD55362.1 methyltransferase, FxLD system [Glycomyces sp. TRM65418]